MKRRRHAGIVQGSIIKGDHTYVGIMPRGGSAGPRGEGWCQVDPELRRTGIPDIGSVPWGSHLCAFCDEREDVLQIGVPFFLAGLERGEACVWVTSEAVQTKEARAAIEDSWHGGKHGGLAPMEYVPHADLSSGEFAPARAVQMWVDRLEGALARGFAGLRALESTFWLEHRLWERFSEYEAELDRAMRGRPILVLCAYSLQRCTGRDVLDVVQRHQIAIARSRGVWARVEVDSLRIAHGGVWESRAELEPQPTLTSTEDKVISLIAEGASNKEIAERLSMSVRTVERHRSIISGKLGFHNRAELVRYAVRRKLFTDPRL